uniref:Putative secreted peptide n=1 Tax=Anopheles braziliensis TaxID=58242 RepID=A0A2M3ZX50_9DIPT
MNVKFCKMQVRPLPWRCTQALRLLGVRAIPTFSSAITTMLLFMRIWHKNWLPFTTLDHPEVSYRFIFSWRMLRAILDRRARWPPR